MPETAYLFIDGAYLRERYQAAMKGVFAAEGDLDLSQLKDWFERYSGYHARRVFYYDCLHDTKKDDETKADFDIRVEAQRKWFDSVQSLPSFHVRYGSLSGKGKKFRQKQVDVLLAIEALDHAFRKNMDACCLIAGDLDFAPLVDALVRFGTWVHVFYDPKSAAKDLYASADDSTALRLHDYHRWSRDVFKSAYALPQERGARSIEDLGMPYQEGVLANSDGRAVYLGKQGEYYIYLQSPTRNGGISVWHKLRDILENYFSLCFGQVEWVRKGDYE